MFRKRKNRDSESDLSQLVKEAVKKVCEWKDACGAKFAVETKTRIGDDFVLLEIFGVDEFRLSDLFALTDDIAVITDYSCNFAKNDKSGCLSFTFENIDRAKKNKSTTVPDDPTSEEDNEEGEEVKLATTCFHLMKKHLSVADAVNAKCTTTSTPGLVVVTTHNISGLDKQCCSALRDLCESKGIKTWIYLEKKYVQMNIRKKKGIVNI